MFTLERLKTANGFKYKEVDAYGDKVTVGTLSAADMVKWIEEGKDEQLRVDRGLRLIVKSVCDGETKARIPEAEREAWVEVFRQKDAKENADLVLAILEFNGFKLATKETEEPKNVSSETSSSVSPTDSLDTSVE